MKLNIIKIKELRIKAYYFYEKKNYLKKSCPQRVIKIMKE